MNTMTSKSLWPRALSGLVLALVVGCAPAGTTEDPGPETPPQGTTTDSPATLPELDPTELRVTFLGTGAPRPSSLRFGPTMLVEAGEHRILVDPSWGLTQRVMQAGSFDLLTGIDHVLITHLHYDHTVGLPELWLGGWLFGRPSPLRIQGPVGTEAMMENFRRAYQWDIDYRLLVGVPDGGQIIAAEDIAPGVVFDEDGLTITAFDVAHMPIDLTTRELLEFEGQTLGFRIDYAERSLVLSGDTRGECVRRRASSWRRSPGA